MVKTSRAGRLNPAERKRKMNYAYELFWSEPYSTFDEMAERLGAIKYIYDIPKVEIAGRTETIVTFKMWYLPQSWDVYFEM